MDFSCMGYNDVRDYVENLEPKDRQTVANRLKEGSLEYGISEEMAKKMEVRVYGRMRPLQWVAENEPGRLEYLLDTMEPGSVLFEAVTLVYNNNLDKIVPAVEKENARIRGAGIEGLYKWAERCKGEKPRARLRMFLKPGVLGEKPRVYLNAGYVKPKPRVYLN